MTKDILTADIIVVGCGIAGLSAAASAAENGTTVHLLERATMEERGGNTRYTESFWRMKDHDTIADDFTERLAKNAAGYLDPEVTKDYSRPYSDWQPLLRAQPALEPRPDRSVGRRHRSRRPLAGKQGREVRLSADLFPHRLHVALSACRR